MEAIQAFVEGIKEKLDRGEYPETLPDRCCADCDGSGWTENGQRCQNYLKRAVKTIVGDYPPLLDLLTSDKYEENLFTLSAREMAKQLFSKKSPIGRVHCSSPGRGKTTVAKSLMVEMFLRGYEWFAEINFPLMVEWYKQGNERMDNIDKWFEKVGYSKFVHVDEYGLEKDTDSNWKHHAMHRILDQCLSRKFLIISTNLTKKQFIESLHVRDCDRFRPDGGYFKIIEEEFDLKKSYRGKK